MRLSIVGVFMAALFAAGLGAARGWADTTPTQTTTTTVGQSPAPDPAPMPAPDPAPVVHAKPKPHVVTHAVRTTPRAVTPAPTPVVVTQAPVVHASTHVAVAPKKHVPRRVHAAKPKATPKHLSVPTPRPAPTTTAAPILVSAGDQTSGRVTSAARVQSFSSQWQRLLSWLLLVGSLIVLACAALPALVPGAGLVVEGRVQLALLGAVLAAGGVSLLVVSGA